MVPFWAKGGVRVLICEQSSKPGDIEHPGAAMEHLWQQSGTMVQAITQEVLGRGVTDQDNHRLILEAVNQIRQQTHEGKA